LLFGFTVLLLPTIGPANISDAEPHPATFKKLRLSTMSSNGEIQEAIKNDFSVYSIVLDSRFRGNDRENAFFL